MTTVPNVPRWEDFSFQLVNISDGTFQILTEQDLLNVDIWVEPAPTTQKLESGSLEAPAGTEDNPSIIASAMDWAAWQAIRIVPYGDTAKEFWGLIVNAQMQYSGSAIRDTLKLSVVPIEYLLHSRVIYDTTDTGFDGGNKAADDLAKFLVKESALGGTVGTDPDGNSRDWNWGTLAVQADASACAAVTADYEIFEDYLDEIITALGLEYGFIWELRPSVAGGALTFTFNTEVTGGVDRTAGANRWIINDFAGRAPSGERHIDRSQLINAMHSRGITEVEIDAASIAAYGRWEGIGQGDDDQALNLDLENTELRTGSSFRYANAYEWMANWDVGDTVIHNNNRLGVTAANDVVGGVRMSFPERVLDIELRWGLKKGSFTQKTKKGAHRQGGGGGGAGSGGPGWALDTLPVSDTFMLGTSRLIPRADHQHDLLVTADDTNTATITAGAVTFQGADDITTSIIAGDLDIDHDDSAVVPGAYGDATHVCQLTVNQRGHLTAAADVLISGVAPSAHDLLSASHGDTSADAVSRGSIIIGSPLPKWDELTVGNANEAVVSDGVDVLWGFPQPAAHVIDGPQHTGVGATLDVVGFSAANTLDVLTPVSDTAGANSKLLKSDANGYLTTERYQVADANAYFYSAGAGNAQIVGSTYAGCKVGGRVCLTDGTSWFSWNGDALGKAANRWQGFWSTSGNFTGDITIGTGVGIIHADGVVAGRVLRADGTRYIPAQLSVTDLTAGAFTGFTQPTLAGNSDTNTNFANRAIESSAGHLYFYCGDAGGANAGWRTARLITGSHEHPLSGGVATATVSNHRHTIT